MEDAGVEIDMTDQILSFVRPEFSVIIEKAGHFSLKQLEKRLLEMSWTCQKRYKQYLNECLISL